MKVCLIYYSRFNSLLVRDVDAHLVRGDEVDVFCYALTNGKNPISSAKLNVHTLMKRGFNEKTPIEYLLKVVYFFFLSLVKVSILHFRKKLDLVHVVSPPDFMVFAGIIPKLLGAKVILNIHDIVPEFYMRKFGVNEKHIVARILRFIEKVCCHFSDHVLTVTHIWRDKLVDRTGIPKSKCTVFMNVPDDKLVNLTRTKETPRNSHFTLLYPGNLGEHFGVESLIRAISIVKNEISSIKLDIYGDGAQKDYLKDLARKLDVEKVIDFHSLIALEELVSVMRQADIGVVPTLDGVFAGEALSGKSLEFLALGTPIIISKTTSTQYYYNDKMVMFFKPGDHKDLAQRIIDLYMNPEKRKEMVRNADAFNKKHSWKNYKGVYYRTVDSLCLKLSQKNG